MKILSLGSLDESLAKSARKELNEIPGKLDKVKDNEARFLYSSLVRANLILDRFGEAIRLSEEAEKSEIYRPCASECWYSVGEFHEYRSYFDAAIKCYLASIRIKEGSRVFKEKSQKKLAELLAMDVREQMKEQIRQQTNKDIWAGMVGAGHNQE
jgi:tetratricopeptide (TPR) repeat protein